MHLPPPNVVYIILIFLTLYCLFLLAVKWRLCEGKDLRVFHIREYLLNK